MFQKFYPNSIVSISGVFKSFRTDIEDDWTFLSAVGLPNDFIVVFFFDLVSVSKLFKHLGYLWSYFLSN